MTGLFLYALAAAGLGQFLPRPTLDGTPFTGLRFVGGYAVFIVGFFVLHAVLRLPLAASAWIVVLAAAMGALRSAARLARDRRSIISLLLHPTTLLLLLGVGAVAVHGGIDYLPYTSDEFSNWLGASRHIVLAGGLDRVGDALHQPNYTPGWRLALLFPWVVTGVIREGDAASAPFVLHLGLAGLVYDVIVWRLRALGAFSDARAMLFAWAAMLAGLAAEIAGLIWVRQLLIEQPQIYTLAAAALLLAVMADWPEARSTSARHAGLILAGAYLLKTAALALAPAVGLLVLVVAWRDGARGVQFVRRVAVLAGWTIGPSLVAAAAWSLVGPGSGQGMPSLLDTLDSRHLGLAAGRDGHDLAARLAAVVATYAGHYKAPMTALALLAVSVAAARGRYAALLLWGAFFAVYVAAVYWYDLAVFDAHEFRTLDSVPRYIRVPIQVLHVLGFAAAAMEASVFLADGRGRTLLDLAGGRAAVVATAAAAGALAGFQGYQVLRSVDDVSTRVYQNVDPRIAEARTAVRVLAGLAGRGLPARPRLVLISQGQDAEPLNYAAYYARGAFAGDPAGVGIRLDGVSWTDGAPKNFWQRRTTAAALRQNFLAADMIWPLTVDAWVTSVLAGVVDDKACAGTPTRYYLVRRPAGDGGAAFACVAKPAR